MFSQRIPLSILEGEEITMTPIEQLICEYGISITNEIVEMHYSLNLELDEEHMPVLRMVGNYLVNQRKQNLKSSSSLRPGLGCN